MVAAGLAERRGPTFLIASTDGDGHMWPFAGIGFDTPPPAQTVSRATWPMTAPSRSTDGITEGAKSIDLQEESSRGVLLLHGFGDTPQTFAMLAAHLHAARFSVRAPLLPGHGRSVEEFTASDRAQWLKAARQELVALRKNHESVAVGGLSMGAAIATILASENTEVKAVVLIAPYLGMRVTYRLASMSHWLWGPLVGTQSSRSPGSILDPEERERNLGHGVFTGRLLHELWRLARDARRSLHAVIAPTLIIQSRSDRRVPASIARHAMKHLGATNKKLVWIEGAGHILTVDYGRDRVFEEVRNWLETYLPEPAAD
jgi:carboxylesterase